jgi:hypothetical protein
MSLYVAKAGRMTALGLSEWRRSSAAMSAAALRGHGSRDPEQPLPQLQKSAADAL